MNIKISWATDIVWRRIDDDVVVIKEDGRTLCTLNKTAAYVWEMCSGEYGPQDIVVAICKQFEANKENALKDVLDILCRFKQLGLVGELRNSKL